MKADTKKSVSTTQWKVGKDYEQVVDREGNSINVNYTGKKEQHKIKL